MSRTRLIWAATAAIATLSSACAPRGVSVGSPTADASGRPVAIDPQQVRDQDDMTWDDYKPIPGANWASGAIVGSKRTMRVAIVPADYPDLPFVLTLKKQSDLFGNPRIDPVKREQIPQFYADFYNKPQPVNQGHTIHEYWMEQSRGRIGVTAVGFGPYRMPHRYFQYGGLPGADMPDSYSPDNGASRQLDSMWRADQGDSIATKFDLVVRVYAGYDETATWQEFGEMKFQTRDDITREWGNPDTTKKRWVPSRYVPWTSWMAGVWPWSNAGGGRITQGESINSIRHEIAHAAFSIGDNYNNPYATPYRRAHAGPWDLMDRGSFNGPFGPHHRFELPPNEGGSMAAGLMLRQRMQFGFVDSSQVLLLTRDGLAKTGVAVADVTARAIDPLPGTLSGIVVRLDGAEPRDRSPLVDPATNPTSSGQPNFDTYTVEVVQRLGYDSFEPDNGVLLAKNKDRSSPPSATQMPNNMSIFTWTIDAHPEDINKLDFKRPNGEPVMRTLGDYRQLNDALFHAGTNSASTYEWEDTPNRLHFYVVNVHHDARGILSYTLGARSLDGSGPQSRGVSLTAPSVTDARGSRWQLNLTLTNTGRAAPTPVDAHPRDESAFLDADVYRISATVDGAGWAVDLQSALAAVKFGATQQIPVFVRHSGAAAESALLTVTATSESDPMKVATVKLTVTR
jgi:M6 family metalloprotease-like protein